MGGVECCSSRNCWPSDKKNIEEHQKKKKEFMNLVDKISKDKGKLNAINTAATKALQDSIAKDQEKARVLFEALIGDETAKPGAANESQLAVQAKLEGNTA